MTRSSTLLEIGTARGRVHLRLLYGDLQAGYGKVDIECTAAPAGSVTYI